MTSSKDFHRKIRMHQASVFSCHCLRHFCGRLFVIISQRLEFTDLNNTYIVEKGRFSFLVFYTDMLHIAIAFKHC